MSKFLLTTSITFLLLLSANAHPEWFAGLQPLIPTPSSNSVQAPPAQQSHSPSLSQSYSPGYQSPQAAQPVQVPTYNQGSLSTYTNKAYGVAQRPVAQPLPPANQNANSIIPKSSGPPPQYAGNQVGQSSSAYGNPSGQNYWFKEGTPVLPCGYGAGTNGIPMPQYSDPRKKCVPWSPMCGFLFTCIMDV